MQKNTALKVGCNLVLLLALAVGFGCAPKSKGLSDATAEGYGTSGSREQEDEAVGRRVRDYLAAEKNDPRGQDVLIKTAKTALGTPYVRGGTSTDGFDCSGFVQWTFNQVGVKLPRTAREQSRVGRAIRNVDDMEVGDIVAFHHPKRGYHTGIYVGEGKFIHSPRKRTKVRIASMDDPYFSKNFLSARRIGVSSSEDIEAAEGMLAEYREQQERRVRTNDNSKKSKQVARADNKRGKKANVRSSNSRNKGKESNSVRKSSNRKAVSKDSKQSKKNVGQVRPLASKNAVASAGNTTKESSRSIKRASSRDTVGTGAAASVRTPATKASAGKQKSRNSSSKTVSQKTSGQKNSGAKTSASKSSAKKTAEKSSAARQKSGTQKKGS